MLDVRRRSYLKAVGTIPLLGSVAGCLSGSDTGVLATHVSDQPTDIEDFQTLHIQINNIRVKPENDELQQIDTDVEIDLTELVGDASELVDETELETGAYEFLQLAAEATEATLSNGDSATVRLPGNAPLKFDESFEIRGDTTTSFTADFTPVKQGQTNQYTLKPVADEVTVSYEEE